MRFCSHHSVGFFVVVVVAAAAVVEASATSPGLNTGPVVDTALGIGLAWEWVVVGDREVAWVVDAAAAAA